MSFIKVVSTCLPLPLFFTNVIAGGVHECEEVWVARYEFGMESHSKAKVKGKVGETIHQNVPRWGHR